MKKLLTFVFVLLMVFAYSVSAMAAPTQPDEDELIQVTPTFPTNRTEVANDTGINVSNFEEVNLYVYTTNTVANSVAKNLLNVNAVNTSILPVFTASATSIGFVAVLTFTVNGKELLATSPNEIKLIGMTSPTVGKLFEYVSNKNDLGNKKFTLQSGGAAFTGEINPSQNYELVVGIKDGGEFDLDGIINGKVISSIFFASKNTDGECFGCDAGYGYFTLTLLGAVPLVFKKRK